MMMILNWTYDHLALVLTVWTMAIIACMYGNNYAYVKDGRLSKTAFVAALAMAGTAIPAGIGGFAAYVILG